MNRIIIITKELLRKRKFNRCIKELESLGYRKKCLEIINEELNRIDKI